jgi:hypothetical protein
LNLIQTKPEHANQRECESPPAAAGQPTSGRCRKHGAYREAKLAPLRERLVGELAEQFGHVASRHEIELAADRRARIAVINEWLDQHGVFADKRSGRPREILTTLERLQVALERQLTEWRRCGGARQREPESEQWLELTAAEKVGLMSSDERVRQETAHRILTRIGDEHHAESLRSTGSEEATGEQALGRRQAAERRTRRRFLRSLSDEDLAALEDLANGAEVKSRHLSSRTVVADGEAGGVRPKRGRIRRWWSATQAEDQPVERRSPWVPRSARAR